MDKKIKETLKNNVNGILKGYLESDYMSEEDIDILKAQIDNEFNFAHGYITKSDYEDFNNALENLMLSQHTGPKGYPVI